MAGLEPGVLRRRQRGGPCARPGRVPADCRRAIVARGRDPYFPPWPDVVQLNAFSPGLRDAVTELLAELGAQCDGLRCDMAMLMTNEVFARTWALEPPAEEFWPAVIGRVKARCPELVLIAEAYWDMEWTLQQQGFDYCYDKRLYDRLGPRRRRRDPRPPVRRRRLPGAAAALHREPRRAARGRDVRRPAGARRGGRGLHAAGRAALSRRPARRASRPHPGLSRPRTRRARRRRPTRLLPAAAARRRRVRPTQRGMAPERQHGLARQRHATATWRRGPGQRPAPATSWS